MPLRRWQLLPDECILLLGPRDDVVRGVGNYRQPTWRKFIRCDQACQAVLILRPPEDVSALAVDLYRHGDAEHKLVDDGGHEQDGHLRLTCCEGHLWSSRNSRLWQRLAEGHKGIDELLHVAIDEHDVAALLQCQRGFSLALELGEVALAKRRRGGQCLQSLDLADEYAVNSRRQSTCFNRQVFPNVVELRVSDANSRVQAEQQERRNDRASEHDLQLPQRSGLAEPGHCSDPQNDGAGDAK